MKAPGLVIVDRHGVPVDGEAISTRVMASGFTEAGVPMGAEETARDLQPPELIGLPGTPGSTGAPTGLG